MDLRSWLRPRHERSRWLRNVGAAMLVLACGSSAPACDLPEVRTPVSGPEQECLDRANAKRTRRSPAPRRIGLQHILVRHVESQNTDPDVTRSRGQACLRAQQALAELRGGKDWDTVVAGYSDEKSAAERHGSLGNPRREDLDPDFAVAAFALEIDELSGVVETPYGFHVIRRTE